MLSLFSNKRPIILLILSSFILPLLYFIFNKDLNFFLLLTFGIKCMMGFVVMTIAVNTYKISQNTIFTFLAISLGFCSIIDFLSMIFNYHYQYSSLLNNHIYLQVFVDFLSISSLILCFRLYDKELNFKNVFIFYSIIVSVFVLLFVSFLFVFNIFPSLSRIVFFNFSIKDILNFILFIFSLYPVSIYIKIKNTDHSSDVKSIFSLSILFTFAMLSFFLSLKNDATSNFSFLGNMLRLYYVFFICKVIINSVLRKPYDVLFCSLNSKSKELEKFNRYYETLIESLPLSILVLRRDNVRFANLSALEIFGYDSKTDIYNINLYDILDESSITTFNENTFKNNENFEAVFKTSSGHCFESEVTQLSLTFDNYICTMIIIKDVSSKKKVDELNQILERKLEEENLRTEFFSNVSHELRTPINVIYSALQLEEVQLKNGSINSTSKHHKTLKQNCLRLLRISNNLIDVTKIDSGYFEANMRCENIVSLIENIVSSVSLFTSSRDINIIFDTDNEDIYTLCDSDLIERIMLNLISNSIKYGSEDGAIWVNIYDENDNIKIIFKDDGPGIEKDKCSSMFERFIQVDRSLNRSCEGSGLGLSLVKSLVEIHSGTISLESDIGLGCNFTILIPNSNCDFSEIRTDNDYFVEDNCVVDKINIEFSDIYF